MHATAIGFANNTSFSISCSSKSLLKFDLRATEKWIQWCTCTCKSWQSRFWYFLIFVSYFLVIVFPFAESAYAVPNYFKHLTSWVVRMFEKKKLQVTKHDWRIVNKVHLYQLVKGLSDSGVAAQGGAARRDVYFRFYFLSLWTFLPTKAVRGEGGWLGIARMEDWMKVGWWICLFQSSIMSYFVPIYSDSMWMHVMCAGTISHTITTSGQFLTTLYNFVSYFKWKHSSWNY